MESFFKEYKLTNYVNAFFLILLGLFVLWVSKLELMNLITMVCYYISFMFFFIIFPLLYKKGNNFLFTNIIREILLFQLHFLKETYVSKYQGSRKLFYYVSIFLGLISFKISNNTGIILALFLLLYINIIILLLGSNETSPVWKFFVENVGYDKCVSIVGNPFSTIGVAVAKSLPKISKPMVKVAGGFLMADVVATKTGFYDYTSETLHDIKHVQKRFMGIETEYKPYDNPPVKSIVDFIMEKSSQ